MYSSDHSQPLYRNYENLWLTFSKHIFFLFDGIQECDIFYKDILHTDTRKHINRFYTVFWNL